MHIRTGIWFPSALVAAIVALASVCTTDMLVQPSQATASSGSAACDACHPGETKTWRETYHAKVARAPHESLLKEAAQYWSTDSKGNAGPSRGNFDGKAYGLDDVEMVVGTRWKQRFLVKNPATGHHQFLDKQWNSYIGVWEGYANKDDWEAGCATCPRFADLRLANEISQKSFCRLSSRITCLGRDA